MRKKCLVLISGGLDSALAARLMQRLGFETEGIAFLTSFQPIPRGGRSHSEEVCGRLGIPLHLVPLDEPFLEIVRSPRYGRGKHLNPCIDCKVLMLRSAWEKAREIGAEFLVTGEVLGQRPMSQNLSALRQIEKASGLKGLIFRPLSARFLDPTRPEQVGLIDRESLPAVQGRGRKLLLALAAELGVSGFSTPAGGCLLTDDGFCRRLSDLMELDLFRGGEVDLVKVGRYLRLGPRLRLIVGRSENENRYLLERAGGRVRLEALGSGP
ncbi:MAG TPA: tRNA 4-thiouridine(8) synthase ThiI, partial [bacterium]|nr:tRNA 4-thiouridine(8) synthase ThiI [bacterium]